MKTKPSLCLSLLAGMLAVAALASAGGCDNNQPSQPSRQPNGQPNAQPNAAPTTAPSTQPSAAAGVPEARAAVALVSADATPARSAQPAGAAQPAAAAAAGTGSAGPDAAVQEVKAAAEARNVKADPAKTPQTARVPGWYQWRGPEQNGVSREKHLPEKWDPETRENLIWDADVGGMSSPVIWNGKLYTFTRAGEVPVQGNVAPGPMTREALTCVDINTGKVLWQHLENMTQTEVPFHRLGWSSPCVDPGTGRVYALGSQCTLVCLEGDSGKEVWSRQMTEEFGLISTFGGRTPSPSLDEDQLFIAGVSFGWGDQARGQHRVYAFDKNTGELNWSNGTGGIPVDAPQNTPVVAVVNGERLVIFGAGDGGVHAFQARTGKKEWTFRASKRGFNTSVVVDGTRLYCAHDLDNFDSNHLGRVFCLDIANVQNGAPKELWKITGIEAGFPTCCVTDKWVYVVDDRCRLYQIDKMTGKQAWKRPMGTVGKPSPVFGDGKLYVADGNGRFTILSPGETEKDTKILSRVDLTEKLAREYAIYGSPALCDGRLYLQTATKLYCIGTKDAKGEYGQIPQLPAEKPAQEKAAVVQVVPADIALHAGAAEKFRVRTFDASGRFIKEVPGEQAKWAIAQLTIPAPPPRPAAPMPRPDNAPASGGAAGGANAAQAQPTAGGREGGTGAATASPIVPPPSGGAAAKGETPDAARAALAAAAATQPAVAAAPTKAGNLQGDVSADGTFHAKAGPHQGGAVEATVDGVTGQARVRVFPPLPWKFDFENVPVKTPPTPPLTWLGAGGKYGVVQDPEDPNNKVLQKLMDIDLYYRARTNFGTVDMANYTVQADAKVNEKVLADRNYKPSAAVMNSRYVLVLDGMSQALQIHVWPSALPDERNPHGSLQTTIPFPFEAKKWYRLKLEVTPQGNKALARGKCWPVGAQEPKDWMLTLTDPIPNSHGNPGLFSVSLVTPIKSEVYYDNILVTPNGQAAAPAANAGADAGAGRSELNK